MEKAGKAKPARDIDGYIAGFPKETRALLEKIRATVRKAAPKAEEVISYSMPAFKWNGILVWFAGHSKHIGFYPGSSGVEAFEKELAGYERSKGTIRFPLDKPLPLGLIAGIVKLRVKENARRAEAKKRY